MVLGKVTALWRRLQRLPEARSWVPEAPAELIAAWQQARSIQSLGAVLNLARTGRGLSLLQLQTATGINATYLVKLEHNLVLQPSLFALVQLSEALDIEIESLINRLSPGAYAPEDLVALERRWRLCVMAQPGNRNAALMLEAIALLWKQALSQRV